MSCCVAASPLVVAVERRLSILLLPGTPEGPGDVPAGAHLAEEHLVQAAAHVVLGAVLRLLRHLLKPEQCRLIIQLIGKLSKMILQWKIDFASERRKVFDCLTWGRQCW